jgi:BioD-like phosphotransacetylase family protein
LGAIYIVSAEPAAGKTAICAGLGKYFTGEGKKVGYLKPLTSGENDTDVSFIRSVLGLADTVNAADIIKGGDTILVEGMIGPNAADSTSQAAYGSAREMKARVIVIEAYTGEPSGFIESYKGFGDNLAGIIINKVPQSQMEKTRELANAAFTEAGITLLGVIPENRRLLAITINELAESLNGRILNNNDKSDDLVENYMLGAMVVDSGLDYFGRKSDKAAIIRHDRPDMQLAALETPTRCLVLSGDNATPVYNVLQRAEIKGIPVITTEYAIGDIIGIIEENLAKSRCHQANKLPALAEMVKQNLDLKVFI